MGIKHYKSTIRIRIIVFVAAKRPVTSAKEVTHLVACLSVYSHNNLKSYGQILMKFNFDGDQHLDPGIF